MRRRHLILGPALGASFSANTCSIIGSVIGSIMGSIVGALPGRAEANDDLARRFAAALARAHALRDAQTRLQRSDLSGLVLVSSSRPCALCEAAAARAGVARMVYGSGIDAGAPRASR